MAFPLSCNGLGAKCCDVTVTCTSRSPAKGLEQGTRPHCSLVACTIVIRLTEIKLTRTTQLRVGCLTANCALIESNSLSTSLNLLKFVQFKTVGRKFSLFSLTHDVRRRELEKVPVELFFPSTLVDSCFYWGSLTIKFCAESAGVPSALLSTFTDFLWVLLWRGRGL